MTQLRLALACSALAAGVSHANLAVALPLTVLAGGGGAFLAGMLIGTNTIAFSLGALLAVPLRRAESGVALGLAAMAAGKLVLPLPTHTAWLYLAFTVAAAFFGSGVWPVVVGGALARVSPAERPDLTIVWNGREYLVIAATTAAGSYLLEAASRPASMLFLAAALLAGAAAAALAALRAPVYAVGTA
ncbi:hypothetical protein Gocc_1500 [Gaiella occulta]|uniref:Major Facilitator Superfamily n=1 Tax=Gaiella occulta TaxID=1002870 RepID=A0A7M2YWV7_9ACTN|nr:hypothetical protein [Gaiella occulta]RDI74611.1 hypothetical protein Gocc_1500 [Gaiella occulta]